MTDQYLDIIEVILVVLDSKANIILLNKKGYEILGYKQGELEEKNWFKTCLPPEEFDTVYDIYLNIITGKTAPFEYLENKIVTKNGDLRTIAWRNKVITDKTGKITGTISSGEDITEKKSYENAVRSLAINYAGLSGKAFFEASSKHIALEMGIDYVYVGELSDNKDSVRVIGGFACGGSMTELVYNLKDTPCSDIINNKFCFYTSKIQQQYPNDLLLQEMGIESYLGAHIFDKNEQPIGILVALHSKPINNSDTLNQLFSIFLERISAELQRMKIEEALIKEINERQQIESTLKLKQFAIDNAADTILWITPEAKIIDANESACRMLGYTREELLQYTIPELDPNYSTEFWALHFDELRQKGSLSFETIQQTKDGKLIPVEVTANYIKYNNKELNCAFIRDISLRKENEKFFSRSKEKLKEAQQISHLGSWYLDIKSNYTEWTEELYKIYGFNPKLPLPPFKERLKMLAPESRELLKVAMVRIAQEGIPYELELNLTRIDGSNRWLWASAKAVLDSNNKTIALSGIAQDITERKQNQLKIDAAYTMVEESERKYKFLYEHNPLPMMIYNYQNLQILSANLAFIEKYGYTEKELLNMSILEIRPESEYKKLRQALKNKDIGNVNFGVFTHKKKNGELIQVEIIGANFNFGKIESRLILINDVTYKIKAKNELLQNNIELQLSKEKAEESDRLKSAFLANMSHEIRTPMNGILGFADLLKEREISSQEQQQYIEIIKESGKRMLNIINDIISISKIESKQMQVAISESNINEHLEYVCNFFKPEVDAKGMQLLLKKALVSKQAIIKTDSEKLYAILINLVKNAIKYSDEGSIEIGYDLVKKQETPYLQFYVKDTGIGIPKDRQQAIFERFIQADISNKMAHQGAGLGLSITKAYVEILKGSIWIESEEGKGSIFYFTLPYNNVQENNPPTTDSLVSEEKESQIKNLKILIAEDDKISEMLITRLVKKYSNNILNARNGFEAIEICNNNPDIDLILMDIQMPKLNGYEATKEIRKFNPEVIIIAQTAFGLLGEKEKVLEIGCNDYLSKPIVKEVLHAMMIKYFETK